MGLEPTTFGITIRRSNRLSYIYQVSRNRLGAAKVGSEADWDKKSFAARHRNVRWRAAMPPAFHADLT